MNKNEKKTGMEQGSQMRISPEEMELIAGTFKNNDRLLRLMRKIFLPEIDPKAPIGQVIDLWMTVKVDEMSPEDALVNIKARNQLITHLDQSLHQLQLIAMNYDSGAKAKVGDDSAK